MGKKLTARSATKKPAQKSASGKKAAPKAALKERAKETLKVAVAKKGTQETKALPVVEAPVAPVKPVRLTRAALEAQETLNKLTAKWTQLFNKTKNVKPVPYSMKNTYESETAIHHKILGWGYIMDNKNDRLEVLFQDGIKYLISNYK